MLIPCVCCAVQTTNTKIAVSIKPIQGIVQGLLGNIDKAHLIIDPKSSPHYFALRPQQITALSVATLLIYVDGSILEPFIKKVQSNYPNLLTLELISIPNLIKNTYNKQQFVCENTQYSKETIKDQHYRSDIDPNKQLDNCYQHKQFIYVDPHVWLDPHKVIHMIPILIEALVDQFPNQRTHIVNNGNTMIEALKMLDYDLMSNNRWRNVNFLSTHNSMGYLAKRYKLHYHGALSKTSVIGLGADDFNRISQVIKDLNVQCIVGDSSEDIDYLSKLATAFDITVKPLDIMGIDIPIDKDFYPTLMRKIMIDIESCIY